MRFVNSSLCRPPLSPTPPPSPVPTRGIAASGSPPSRRVTVRAACCTKSTAPSTYQPGFEPMVPISPSQIFDACLRVWLRPLSRLPHALTQGTAMRKADGRAETLADVEPGVGRQKPRIARELRHIAGDNEHVAGGHGGIQGQTSLLEARRWWKTVAPTRRRGAALSSSSRRGTCAMRCCFGRSRPDARAGSRSPLDRRVLFARGCRRRRRRRATGGREEA